MECFNALAATANSITKIENKSIQVIDDGRTKESIKHIIAGKLDEYGFQYEVVDISQSNSSTTDNPKLTYSANWWWDMASYMRFLNVEIKARCFLNLSSHNHCNLLPKANHRLLSLDNQRACCR